MRAVKAGNLNQRINLQVLSASTRDSFGQTIPGNWVDGPSYWAQVLPVRARDIIVSGQVKAQVTHTVRMRYPGASIDMSPSTHRILLKGRTLGIVGFINVEEKNQMVELACQEIEA